MVVFRIVGPLILVGLVAFLFAYLYTGQKKYLDLAKKLLRFAMLAALILLALLVSERLLILL